jgi:hypothetical protein
MTRTIGIVLFPISKIRRHRPARGPPMMAKFSGGTAYPDLEDAGPSPLLDRYCRIT